jgi:HlyD family secretion protein
VPASVVLRDSSALRRDQPRPTVPIGEPQAADLQPRDPRRFWSVLIAAIAVVAVLSVYHRQVLQPQPPQLTAVRTVRVGPGTVEQTIRLVGSTAAAQSIYLRAPYMPGSHSGGGGGGDFRLVLEKLAVAGAQVSKGDTLAKFDDLFMATRLDDYKAMRVQHENSLKVLLQNREVRRGAHQQLIRVARARVDKVVLDLKTAPVRSAIQIEHFQLALAEAQASYAALLNQTADNEASDAANLRRAQLDLEEAIVEERRARANLNRMTARAPQRGLVVLLDTFRGSDFAQFGAGDEVRPGQPYAQIVDTRSTIVEAKANQADVMDLHAGATVRVRFDAYPDLMVPGRLQSISPLSKSAGWRRSYISEVPVRIKLDAMDPRIIPGLTVSAEVILRSEASDSIVAREAVSYEPGEDHPVAYVKSDSGWEKRDLKLGLANHIAIAVHAGLQAGDLAAAEIPPSQ